MSSPELKTEPDTRTRILEATWRLMEKGRGQGVRMGDIAKAAGVSRQAVYLHFESRTELIIATVDYVDEIKGLDERLALFRGAASGVALLEASIEVWGNHIPQIYGIAKALFSTRETDEASAAAWDSRMSGLRRYCTEVIEALDREGMLAPEWSRDQAIELYWTIISIHNWEQLTIECGWTTAEYIERITTVLKRTFVASAGGKK